MYCFQYTASDCYVETPSRITILTDSEPFFARLSELVGSGWLLVRATTPDLDAPIELTRPPAGLTAAPVLLPCSE